MADRLLFAHDVPLRKVQIVLAKTEQKVYKFIMDTADFREALKNLGISQVNLARLVSVTPRAVSLWANGAREVPGPVQAYLRLLASLPKALQAQEMTRLKKEDSIMLDGMYAVNFAGKFGQGNGVIVLSGGIVFGSDTAGVEYDGSYEPSQTHPDGIDIRLNLTVPPGVWLVQGVQGQQVEYRFGIDLTFDPRESNTVEVNTPFGKVLVTIDFLRSIPKELAA